MKTIITLITFVIILSTQALAQTGGDLHVKGKIRSDSIANQNYLLIYADSTGTLDTLPPGAAGQVLISNGIGEKPYWGNTRSDSVLYSDFTSVMNVANTTEQVLNSYTLPGNTLNSDGSYIEVEAFGCVNINGTIYIKLMLDSYTIAIKGYAGPFSEPYGFYLYTKIYRLDNSIQKVIGSNAAYGTLYNFLSKDLSNNLTIDFVAQNNSAIANSVTLEGFFVRLIK